MAENLQLILKFALRILVYVLPSEHALRILKQPGWEYQTHSLSETQLSLGKTQLEKHFRD